MCAAGQTDEQLRDLAYMLFAACCVASPHHRGLMPVVRQQLEIDEARAADIARVLRHVQGKPPTPLDCGMSESHDS